MIDENNKKFKDVTEIHCSDGISSITATSQYIAVGCLDDNIYVWEGSVGNLSRDAKNGGNVLGVIDLAIDRKSTHLAVSCMDSTVKIYDLAESQDFVPTVIEHKFMRNWKVEFYNNLIVTCGELGKITTHDLNSKEEIEETVMGNYFLTSLAMSQKEGNLRAVGNSNGQVYITNLFNKKQVYLKPHFKTIRSLCFIQEDTKVTTACDDGSIMVIDLTSQKVESIFEGHKQTVSGVSPYQLDSNVMFSTSFDKTIRCWDIREKNNVGVKVTSSPIWDIASIGKYIFTGGQNGSLAVYCFD